MAEDYYIVSTIGKACEIGGTTSPVDLSTKLVGVGNVIHNTPTNMNVSIVDNPKIPYSQSGYGENTRVLEIDLKKRDNTRLTKLLNINIIPGLKDGNNNYIYGNASVNNIPTLSTQQIVGDNASLSSTANTGYSFLEWRDLLNEIIEDNNGVVSMSMPNRTVNIDGFFYKNPVNKVIRIVDINRRLYTYEQYANLKNQSESLPEILGVAMLDFNCLINSNPTWLILYKNYLNEGDVANKGYKMANVATLPGTADSPFHYDDTPFNTFLEPVDGLEESNVYANYSSYSGLEYAAYRVNQMNNNSGIGGLTNWHVPNAYELTQLFTYADDNSPEVQETNGSINSHFILCNSAKIKTSNNVNGHWTTSLRGEPIIPFVMSLHSDNNFMLHKTYIKANNYNYLRPVARWEANPVNIVYMRNGGTGNLPPSGVCYVGESFIVSDNIDLIKGGYYFNGWNSNSNGTGVHYTPGETIILANPGTIVLWAEWLPVNDTKYIVSFKYDTIPNSNLFKGYNYSIEVTDRGKVTKPTTDVTNDAYVLDNNWYTDTTFSSTWNFDTDIVTSNTILYAHWTIKNYYVTFSLNGRSSSQYQPPLQIISYGDNVVKPSDPVDNTYFFNGWYTEPECIVKWDFEKNIVVGRTYLYAGWEKYGNGNAVYRIHSKIFLNFNGIIQASTLTINNPKKKLPDIYKRGDVNSELITIPFEVNTFEKWTDLIDLSLVGFKIYNKVNYTDYSEIVPGTIELRYNNQLGGGELVQTINAHRDVQNVDPTELGPHPFTAGEYAYYATFQTTLKEICNTNTNLVLSGIGTTNNPYELYLNIYINAGNNIYYLVQFNLNGHGTTEIPDQTVKSGDAVIKPSNPVDSNYYFYGWYKEKECIHPWNFSSDLVFDNTTLYARWISINEYNVFYVYQIETYTYTHEAPETPVKKQAGIRFNLPSTDPDILPEHQLFIGWKCDYDNQLYTKNDTFMMPEQDVTFTAIFVAGNIIECNVRDTITLEKISTFDVKINGTSISYSSNNDYNCIFTKPASYNDFLINVSSNGYYPYEGTYNDVTIYDLHHNDIFLTPYSTDNNEFYISLDSYTQLANPKAEWIGRTELVYGYTLYYEYENENGSVIFCNDGGKTQNRYILSNIERGYHAILYINGKLISGHCSVTKMGYTDSVRGEGVPYYDVYVPQSIQVNDWFNVDLHEFLYYNTGAQATCIGPVPGFSTGFGQKNLVSCRGVYGNVSDVKAHECIRGKLDTSYDFDVSINLYNSSNKSGVYGGVDLGLYPPNMCDITLCIYGKTYKFRNKISLQPGHIWYYQYWYDIFYLRYEGNQWKCYVNRTNADVIIEPSSGSIIAN